MGKNTVSVVVDIRAQAEGLNKVIEQSKKNLQTLAPNIDTKQSNALMKQFDNLQLRVDNFKAKMASGLNSQAAFSKAGQDVRRFGEEYNTIIQKIQGLGIDPNKIIPNTQEVQTEMKKLEKLFERQSEIIGQKLGKGISKNLNKELSNAAKSGNVKGVQDIGKKAASDLTANKRSLIAQRGQITKFYGQNAEEKIQAELTNQKNLYKQDPAAQKAQAQKFGKNIGQLENDLKIVQQHKAYKDNHKAIIDATQAYAQQATQLNNLQIEIDETTGKITIMAQPARAEAAGALNELGNSVNKVKTETDNMNQTLDRTQQEFTETSAKAKQFSQIKSYFAYFFSAGTIINQFSQAVRGAIRDFSELDKQFNEISIVTGKTMDDLWGQFGNLNKVAQEYGVQTKNVVSVQKLYYQQGRSMADVTRLTGETLKFARISGLDYAEATDYMTASLNAYKIAAEDASKITDTFAALSSTAAVDANEVAVAMSKVASLAAGAGSSFEDTSAYLAKIIETTREAPETAGTALKTIIARFTEVKDLTEEEAALLDEDFNFNNIEKALKTVGIQSKDANGQLRGFSDILNDLGPIWEDLSTNQQRYIATAAAGARQQSRFIALMDDWGRTQELQSTAMNSAGLGTKQMALAMDSIETATNRLKSSWQEFYANFLDSTAIKNGIDLLNGLLNVMNDLIDVPVLGPATIVVAIATITKLLKMAKGWGVSFAKSFNTAANLEDAKNSAKRMKYRTTEAAREGIAKAKAEGVAKEKVELAQQKLDEIQAMKNGAAEGKYEGIAKAYAQATEEEKGEMVKQRLDEIQAAINGQKEGMIEGKAKSLGEMLGQKFGKSKNEGFLSGLRHPLQTLGKTKGGYRAAQVAQLGTAAGPAMAPGAGLATASGTVVGGATSGVAAGGAAAGGAAIAGSVLAGVGIAALVAVIIKYIIEAVQAGMEKKVLKATQEASEHIATSVDKITKITNNYTTALELQRKGLTRTEEEMEKYNSSLEELKQTYPQLVKTMSDGTLELAANADSMYSQILEKERENIRQQSDAQYDRAKLDRSVSAGVALSEESIALQENVKTTAANLSSLNKDALKDLGLEGVKLDKLNEMAEKGVNRQSLNEAVNRSMGIERYNNLIDAMIEGGGYDRGEDSKEWRMMEYLAKQNGQTIQEFAQTIKDGSGEKGAAEQEAKALAQSYAAEVDTTLSTVTQDGAVRVMQDDKDNGEDKIKAYFYTSEKKREAFEKDVNSMMTDMSIKEAQSLDSNKYDFSNEDAAEFANKTLEAQREVFNESLEYQIKQYQDATGKAFGEVIKDKDGNITGIDIDDYFKDMSLTEIEGYVDMISQIANKYGQGAARNFEYHYKTFRDEVLAGNTKLQQEFSQIDMMDTQSIAQFGAKIAQQYGIASNAYMQFVDTVESGNNILDRNFRNADQVINDVATDIETLQGKMETLGKASSGELELADMFRLISESSGELDFDDFTATSKGYQLSQEKILATREKMIELQLLEYKLEVEMNRLQMEQYKAEILSEDATNKLKEHGIELNKVELEQFLAAYELSIKKGEAIAEQHKATLKALEAENLLLNAAYAIQLKQANEALAKVDEYISEINVELDTTNSALGRTITKLEKLLEILKKVDFYSDINAYLDDLQLKIDSLDFTIEFTSNADTFADTTIDKINTLNEQVNANLAKFNQAQFQADAYRKSLETNWSDYVSFDENGNILTNGDAISQWADQIATMAASNDENVRNAAQVEEDKLESLLDQIDAYRDEKKLAGETALAAKKGLKAIEDTTKQLRTNVVSLEDTIKDLLIQRDEEALEALEERYDKMKEMDSEYLDSVRDAIEEERRLRDQSQSYEDVAQMERRLALLQMGGGSAVEIQQLQKEIEQARQDIANTEQDNILDGIEKDNEARAAAMDSEVEYQQAVLEEKKNNLILYNQEVATIMQQGYDTIISTWMQLDNDYKTGTETNKALLLANMQAMTTQGIGSAQVLADTGIQKIEDAYLDVKDKGIYEVDSAMQEYGNTVSSVSNGVVSSIKSIESAYFNAARGAEALLEVERELNKERGNASYDYQNSTDDVTAPGGNVPEKTYRHNVEQTATGMSGNTLYKINGTWYTKDGLDLSTDGKQANLGSARVAGNFDISSLKNINGSNFDPYNGKFFYKGLNGEYIEFDYSDSLHGGTRLINALRNFSIDGYVKELQNGSRLYKTNKTVAGAELYLNQTALNGILGYNESAQLYKLFGLTPYAKGGMVDFTGPAWVDGTKSHPEAFLSANDTQLIASLRDILRVGISPTAFAATSLQKSGDTYYTIHINVDELGDGYSVDDLVEEMEQRILEVTGQNGVVKLK